MNELIDILDDAGNFTGKTEKRSIIHSTGLWHRVVHIYFYRKINESIEILVHLRAKTKDLHPNKWDTRFGGHLKAGESSESAIRQELLEETGLKIDNNNLKLGPSYKNQNFPNNEFVSAYFYNFNGDINSLIFNDGEVQEVKWMKTEDIINSMSTDTELWASNIKKFNKIVDEIKDYQ